MPNTLKFLFTFSLNFIEAVPNRDETIRSSHDTIRINTKCDDMVIFDTIRYKTDDNCKNINIHKVHIHVHTNIHNAHILLFMNTTRMLRLVSFTNTVARFTKELDKTNLFVKLKNQCTVKFFL